jgi:hypothetical protein
MYKPNSYSYLNFNSLGGGFENILDWSEKFDQSTLFVLVAVSGFLTCSAAFAVLFVYFGRTIFLVVLSTKIALLTDLTTNNMC